jgi:hypothetical protein
MPWIAPTRGPLAVPAFAKCLDAQEFRMFLDIHRGRNGPEYELDHAALSLHLYRELARASLGEVVDRLRNLFELVGVLDGHL